MRGFLVRWLIHALSLWLASVLVEGIRFPEASALHVIVVAAIFGVVNALVRPLVALATCSLYLLTLGLFHFVVNALMLWLTAWIAGSWFHVAGFLDALFGALIISVVGTVLAWLLDPPDRGRPEERRVIVVRG